MGTLFDLSLMENIHNRNGNVFNFNDPDIIVKHVCAVAI